MPKRQRQHQQPPLQGIVACLSGMDLDQKKYLHELITTLGGTFTRHLNPKITTHLLITTTMANNNGGSQKYEVALQYGLFIVRPEWLTACATAMQRVEERHFAVSRCCLSLLLDQLHDHQPSRLFVHCNFFLVGFDNDKTTFPILTKLIRRAWGTIYWDISDDNVTTIVVKDNESSFSCPAGAVAVSTQWIVDCIVQDTLLPTTTKDYAPTVVPSKTAAASSSLLLSNDPTETATKTTRLPIFAGRLFVLSRVAPPNNHGFVDFDSVVLQKHILDRGGHLLSDQYVAAILADRKHSRTVYVVGWGGTTAPHTMVQSIASLCDICYVNPVWLLTCCQQQTIVVSPTQHGRLFARTDHAVRKFSQPVSVSVTGFTGSQRVAIVQHIRSMEGGFDDSMTTCTTHLICHKRNATDSYKYQTARQWKVHTVSLDWLYSVAQFGMERSPESDFAL